MDGFIAGPDDDVSRLFKWYFSGDIVIPAPDTKMVFKVASASVEIIQELLGSFGAIVTRRRDFDLSKAWGGKSPLGVPIFIVTHTVPKEWVKLESPFTFVTDSVESALEQARKVAGDKNIAVGGTKITQQLLKAGLLDEIHIDLAPILLGDGCMSSKQPVEKVRYSPDTLVRVTEKQPRVRDVGTKRVGLQSPFDTLFRGFGPQQPFLSPS